MAAALSYAMVLQVAPAATARLIGRSSPPLQVVAVTAVGDGDRRAAAHRGRPPGRHHRHVGRGWSRWPSSRSSSGRWPASAVIQDRPCGARVRGHGGADRARPGCSRPSSRPSSGPTTCGPGTRSRSPTRCGCSGGSAGRRRLGDHHGLRRRGDGPRRARRLRRAAAGDPARVPPLRADPRHLPADRAGAGAGDRGRRLRRERPLAPGQPGWRWRSAASSACPSPTCWTWNTRR